MEPLESGHIGLEVLGQCLTHMSCVTRKPTLRSLSLTYQRKDWRAGLCQSFFWHDTNYNIVLVHCCRHRLYSVVYIIPKFFFFYDNDKDPKFGFLVTQLIYNITVYIHFKSIYCIWMVSLFDWQAIAKAAQPIAKHFSKWGMEQPQWVILKNSFVTVIGLHLWILLQ